MTNARRIFARWEVGLVALALVVVLTGDLTNGALLSSYNLQTTALNSIVLLCLALGLAPVIMASDIDLSVVGTLSLAGVFMARLWSGGIDIWVAAGLGLLVGLACGLVNGLIVVLLDLPALAVTLGTLGAYTGVSFLILKGNAIINFPSALVTLGSSNITGTPVPISLVVVIGLGMVLTYIIHGTRFGKSLFAVGGSRRAALFSGIAVNQVRIMAFVVSGLFAGIAAVFYLGNYDTAQAGMASDQLLPAVTAVILGGVSAYGGTGTVPGVAVAAALLALLQSALGLHGLSGEGQTIAVGVLLVIAMGAGSFLRSVSGLRSRAVGQTRLDTAPAVADRSGG
jgi:rhamnose transport system permease protein